MKKPTLKNKQKLSKKNNITVIFGYGLFALTILGLILQTVIPFSGAIFYPTSRHFNIIVTLITLVVAAILPALGSYILGDRATHNKSREMHHYNGVLFGVAAYWVASVFSYAGYSFFSSIGDLKFPFTMVIGNGVPIILAIAVMAFLAIIYSKKQRTTSSVMEYRPYQIVLVGSIIALNLIVATSGNYDAAFKFWEIITPYVYLIGLVTVSYKVLAKYHTSRLARLTDAMIAMSFSYITLALMSSFIAYLNLHWVAVMIWSYIIALVVWVTYLYIRNRKTA